MPENDCINLSAADILDDNRENPVPIEEYFPPDQLHGVATLGVELDARSDPATTDWRYCTMPEREEVKKKVIYDLSVISGFDEGRIQESDELESGLGMSSDMRGSLAPGFERIARAYNAGAVITKSECKKLVNVKQSVDLVFKRCTFTREK